MSYRPVSAPSSRRSLVWRAFAAFVALLNDRLLPQRYHLDAEAVARRFDAALAWCRQYLADRDPGASQYRGLPLSADPTEVQRIPASARVMYRGCPMAVGIVASMDAPAQRLYTPWYQTKLKAVRLRFGLADVDALAPTPELQPSYRGVACK